MSPKITIIIPIYKVEKYLSRCLDSVLNQTFTDWNAILVDDGSPDNSGKIADEYAEHDKRFIVVHKKNGGLSSARNAGLKCATGKYIMFLDSDDCIHPQTMEILYTLAERENVDIVSFDYNREMHNANDAVDFPPDKMPEYFLSKFNLNKIKYKRVKNLITKSTNEDKGIRSWYVQMCMVWMRMYRRDFINGLLFDESVRTMEDVLFWSMVLLRRPNAVITHLPLYYYTVNSTSILHSNNGIRPLLDTIYGISVAATAFCVNAKPCDARIWYKRFLWNMLSRVYNAAMKIQNQNDKEIIIAKLQEMQSKGLLNLAPDFHACRYRRRILKFISQNFSDK